MLPLAQRAAESLLGWLATYAIHSTILILLAALIARALSRRGRPVMSALWGMALLGGVVTATLQATHIVPSPTGTVHLATQTPAGRMRVTVREARTVVSPGNLSANPAPPVQEFEARIVGGRTWPLVMLLVWLAAAGAGLVFVWMARLRFHRMLSDRVDGEYTLAGLALREVRRRAGVERPIRVSISRRLTSPVAIGPDEICLPARALAELDPLQLETILAHELAHLERRDPLLLVATCVVEAVFFFQPLNRWARRRMQEDAEFASDAWAVRVVSQPLTLARCLARVAEWTVAGSALPAPAMVERRTSALVERVRRLTSRRPEPVVRRWLPVAGAALLLLLGALAPGASIGTPLLTSNAVRRDAFVFMTRDSLPPAVAQRDHSPRNVLLLRLGAR